MKTVIGNDITCYIDYSLKTHFTSKGKKENRLGRY